MPRRDLSKPVVDTRRKLVTAVTHNGVIYDEGTTEAQALEIPPDDNGRGFPMDGPWWNDYIEAGKGKKMHPQTIHSMRAGTYVPGYGSIERGKVPDLYAGDDESDADEEVSAADLSEVADASDDKESDDEESDEASDSDEQEASDSDGADEKEEDAPSGVVRVRGPGTARQRRARAAAKKRRQGR